MDNNTNEHNTGTKRNENDVPKLHSWQIYLHSSRKMKTFSRRPTPCSLDSFVFMYLFAEREVGRERRLYFNFCPYAALGKLFHSNDWFIPSDWRRRHFTIDDAEEVDDDAEMTTQWWFWMRNESECKMRRYSRWICTCQYSLFQFCQEFLRFVSDLPFACSPIFCSSLSFFRTRARHICHAPNPSLASERPSPAPGYCSCECISRAICSTLRVCKQISPLSYCFLRLTGARPLPVLSPAYASMSPAHRIDD